jgi:hypothetical protein
MNTTMKKAMIGVAFMLIFAVSIGTALAATVPTTGVQKTPYLIYPLVNTEMEVLWQDYDTEATNTVSWGTDKTYGLGSQVVVESAPLGNLVNNPHQHMFKITGLQPDTMYYYQVSDPSWSTPYMGSFMTAPAVGKSHVKFLGQGDSRNQTWGLDGLMQAESWFYQQPGNAEYQRLSIHNGDWVSTDGEKYWNGEWFTGFPNIVKYTANVPIDGFKGNHDNASGYSATFPKYFPYAYPNLTVKTHAANPTCTPVDANGNCVDSNGNPYYNNLYYSYDYGPVHFIFIDEYSSMAAGSAQYNWVLADLAAASANRQNVPWIIMGYHEGSYSAGADGDNTAVRIFDPFIAQYGVDLVYSGHSHNYARAGAYNAAQANGDPIALNVPYITSGGGGAPVYYTDWTNAPADGWPHVITAWPAFEFMTFDIEGNTLTMTSYQVNNMQGIPTPQSIECTESSTVPFVPTCPSFTPVPPSISPIETTVLHHFTKNATSQVSYQLANFVYNRATATYSGSVTITNNGPALTGNVDVVLDGLLDLNNVNQNVVNNPTGTAANGVYQPLINQYTTSKFVNSSIPKCPAVGCTATSMIAEYAATGGAGTSSASSALLTTVQLVNATGSNNGEPLIKASATGLASGASVTVPLQFKVVGPQNGNPAFNKLTFTPVIFQE